MKKGIFWAAGLALLLAGSIVLAQAPGGMRGSGRGAFGGVCPFGGPGASGGQRGFNGPGSGFGMRGGGNGSLLGPMAVRLLQLTPAQQEAIQAERTACQQATQPIRERIRGVQQQISEGVRNGATDATLEGLARQAGDLSGELRAVSLKSQSKIHNTILTAEQRSKLDALRSEMGNWRQNRQNRRGPSRAPSTAPGLAQPPDGF